MSQNIPRKLAEPRLKLERPSRDGSGNRREKRHSQAGSAQIQDHDSAETIALSSNTPLGTTEARWQGHQRCEGPLHRTQNQQGADSEISTLKNQTASDEQESCI
jgi:hypothetical protein